MRHPANGSYSVPELDGSEPERASHAREIAQHAHRVHQGGVGLVRAEVGQLVPERVNPRDDRSRQDGFRASTVIEPDAGASVPSESEGFKQRACAGTMLPLYERE
jgi:hypothetical protein